MHAASEKSGLKTLRMGKDLHTRLTAEAERQGVDLNRLIVQVMAEYLGRVYRPMTPERYEEMTRFKGEMLLKAFAGEQMTDKESDRFAAYEQERIIGVPR